MSVWRGEQCPKRGPGLSHTMATYSFSAGSTCRECGAVLHSQPPEGVPSGASEADTGRAQYATIFDHKYVFSITGLCSRANCRQPQDSHADFRVLAKSEDCVVDHRSVQPWAECNICKEIVEPAMVTKPPPVPGTTDSPIWMNRRILDKLDAIHAGWMVGYFKS